jgi:cytoskeletal protein RodZ
MSIEQESSSTNENERKTPERVGPYIRRAREAAGLSQEELAREVRLTQEVLKHIEQEEFDKLPVEAYIRSYLNSICQRLELDSNKVLHWFEEEFYGAVRSTTPPPKDILDWMEEDKNDRSVALLIPVIILLLLGGLGWWYYSQNGTLAFWDKFSLSNTSELSDSISSSQELVSSSTIAASSLSGVSSSLKHSSSAPYSSAPIVSSAENIELLSPPPQAVNNDNAEKEEPQAIIPKGKSTLKFRCIEGKDWVRIFRYGPNRKRWTRTLDASRRFRTVEHNDTINVWLKNPDNWEFQLNGSTIQPSRYFQVLNGSVITQ